MTRGVGENADLFGRSLRIFAYAFRFRLRQSCGINRVLSRSRCGFGLGDGRACRSGEAPCKGAWLLFLRRSHVRIAYFPIAAGAAVRRWASGGIFDISAISNLVNRSIWTGNAQKATFAFRMREQNMRNRGCGGKVGPFPTLQVPGSDGTAPGSCSPDRS